MRKTVAKTIELDPRQTFPCGFARVRLTRKKKRQFHVFNRGQSMEQLERLKNEANFFAAQLRQASVIQ